jgi:uracil-DNA glycosylase family 4
MYTIDELTEIIKHCNKCDLCNSRTNVVVGQGNINSKIMIIGEGPGENEDLTGLPFVGKAGKLLDKMLLAINLDRTNTYICNIVKCRPPNNRTPEIEEVNACMDYLRYQFLIMKPKIVILLGSTASKAILGQNFSITKDHGVLREIKGVIFIPTFHPSALLRDVNKKPLAWEDFKKIRDKIKELNIL